MDRHEQRGIIPAVREFLLLVHKLRTGFSLEEVYKSAHGLGYSYFESRCVSGWK